MTDTTEHSRQFRTIIPEKYRQRHVLRVAGAAGVLALTLTAGGCPVSVNNSESGGNANGGSNTVSCPVSSNIETSYDFFVNRGLTPPQSAGIVGNLDQESYCDDPDTSNGIAQWTDPTRHSDYINYVDQRGGATLYNQLSFIWAEMNDKIPGDDQSQALNDIENDDTSGAAADDFSQDFEGCGQCENTQRETYASETLADAQKYGWAGF